MVLTARLCADVQWPMDGTSILEAICPLGESDLTERCLLFSVFVGDDVIPPLDNPTKTLLLYDRFPDTPTPSSFEPHHPDKYTPKQRLLGYDVEC